MKPSSPCEIIPAGPEDGPEEGEIVSDDFEDISDESIIFTPCIGKSLSRNDHLHALSLSSVTDFEESLLEKRRKRKRSHSYRHNRRQKRSRRKLIDSDSSDDDTTLDRRLKLQLKAAVRVDSEEAHKNSLRTRLRAMVGTSEPESDNGTIKPKLEEPGVNIMVSSSDNALSLAEKDTSVIEIDSGTDSVVSAPEGIPSATEIVLSATEHALSATENVETGAEQLKDDIDSELIQLRIEALKTAINNKFANRKRRKKNSVNGTPSDDTNKENTNINKVENQGNKSEIAVAIPQLSLQLSNEAENNEPPSPEEDEDVLRALLLASMSKKMTNIEPEPIKSLTTKVPAKSASVNFVKLITNAGTKNKNNFKLNNVKRVVNNVKNVVNKAAGNTKLVKMPQVKPLIINVNSDSDSDLDFSSSPEKSPKKPAKNGDNDTNIKLVQNRVVQNLGATIESSVEKFLREQRAKVESEIQKVNKAGSEILTSMPEAAKIVTTIKDTIPPNNENALEQAVVMKKAQYTKQVTSDANKITSNTNNMNTSKNKQTYNTTPPNSKNVKLADLGKSALKFLPENKREEYKQLQNLLKLRRAQLKKPRVRKASQKASENNSKNVINKNHVSGDKNGITIKTATSCDSQIILSNSKPPVMPVVSKIKQNKAKLINNPAKYISVHNERNLKVESTNQLSKNEARSQERRNQQLRVETRYQERKSDALLLHTTLKDMQTRKDGRLQIQERYKSLLPLVKKINNISKEQKNWDQQVKKLLEQLAQAREKQQEVHQKMSAFVKELAEKRQKIDESPTKINNKRKISNLITSTPLKQNTFTTSLDISPVDSLVSSISLGLSVAEQAANIESTLKDKNDSGQKGEVSVENDGSKITMLNNWEESTIVNNNNVTKEVVIKRIVSDTDLNVVDPNDIDNIIKKTEERVAVLEKKGSFECRRSKKVRYVSPLDSVKRKEDFDPFAIMCPFEVNGMCKDPECSFKHLPK